MNIERLPTFTEPAAKLWASIPAPAKKMLLSNAWCSNCRTGVTLKNFSGTVKAGDLVLVGQCAVCGGDAARLIELG